MSAGRIVKQGQYVPAIVMVVGLALLAGGVFAGHYAPSRGFVVFGRVLQFLGLVGFAWSGFRLPVVKGYSPAWGLAIAPVVYAWVLCAAMPAQATYSGLVLGIPGILGWFIILGLPDRHERSLSVAAAAWQVAAFVTLMLGSVVSLIPFLWMVTSSFKDLSKVFADPVQIWPDPWLWANYAKAFQKLPFWLYTWNTVKITAICLVGQLLSCSLVAFGFARMRFPGRNVLFLVLLSTMMLPAQVTMIPVFKIWATLGAYDTFVPLTLPAFFGSAFFIFLLRQYYMTIPHEMDESARIDGASTWQVYWKVLLPQSKPALATVAIFSFMAHWNDFLGPLIYLSSPAKRTLALGLYAFQGQYSTDMNYLMAASTVVMLPLLVLFFIGQKYFIQGVVISGVKG